MPCVGKDSWRADSGAVNDAIGAVGKFVSDMSDNRANICAVDAGLVGAMIAGISVLRGNNLATATGAGTVIADLVIL